MGNQCKKQKRLVLDKEWDILIVLDACRYDYFLDEYSNFVEGELEKVSSGYVRTDEWIKNTFGEKYHKDIVYVSANPYINSKGIEASDNLFANEYFYKVVDAWDKGWSKDLSITPPEEVSKLTFRAIENNPDKKVVAHFMQPHIPYIPLIKEEKGIFNKMVGFVKNIAVDVLGYKRAKKFQKLLNLQQPRGVKDVAERYNKSKLSFYYRENLKLALKEVKEIVEKSGKDKIIVTSDHGEFLGENELYGHASENDREKYREKEIIEKVPWLEIKNI